MQKKGDDCKCSTNQGTPRLAMLSTITLIAHDTCKDDMVSFALAYAPILARYKLIAAQDEGSKN